VVNWWTGAYRVKDGGSPPPEWAAANAAAQARQASEHAREQARLARDMASEWRHQAADMRHKVRSGAISARRAAREQIKEARRRAREIRSRARKHRRVAVAERQPTAVLSAIVLMAMLAGGALLVTLLSGRSHSPHVVVTESFAEAPMVAEVKADAGRPLLVVTSVHEDLAPFITERTNDIARGYREAGYDVIMSNRLVESGVRELLEAWQEDPDDESVDEALEDLLEEYSLYGLLHVRESGGADVVDGTVIRSTRPGANDRRFPVVAEPAVNLPYLLINDHPTKHDPETSLGIERSVAAYQLRGWPVIVDPESEATVRAELPAGPIGAETTIPERVHTFLVDHGLGGILYIDGSRSDESGRPLIDVRRIDADEHAVPGLPTPPGDPAAGSSRIDVEASGCGAAV
jgi:hypothetical protein